ncbi:MAG: hypothetical protein V4559_15470 [Pseudomonadota bacterium]
MRALFLTLLALGPVAAQAAPNVERWNLPGISSPMWESHPAIDPLTGDLWFVRSDKKFSGWRILVSHCDKGRWSDPKASPFARAGLEADPFFTADGRTLYFISTRATGAGTSAALDIWLARRDAQNAWGVPERLPAPVNSPEAEWFPRPGLDGWLYFGSRRSGGMGKDDIWRAHKNSDESWIVENAGPGLNSADAEYEFQPAPDGKWGILATDKGLYRVEKTRKGWERREKFGPEINVDTSGIGPMIAPYGRMFVFSRDMGGNQSGELFAAHLDGAAKWPPVCAGRP